MTFRTTIMLIMAFLLTFSISIQTIASTLKLYSANYSAEFNGLEVKATNRIEELSPGHYKETLIARNILGKIYEETLFSISKEHQIIPQQYSRQQSIMGVARKESQLFDWPNTQLRYTKKGQTSETPITVGTLDKRKLKQYTYEMIGSEVLETAIGPLNTVKMQRFAAGGKRQTTIWLAVDWNYLIVKFNRMKDGESYNMDFIDGEVNNTPVIPLQTVTEK
jgi:hypothetical protein